MLSETLSRSSTAGGAKTSDPTTTTKNELKCVYLVSAGDFRPQPVGVFGSFDAATVALKKLFARSGSEDQMVPKKAKDAQSWTVKWQHPDVTSTLFVIDVMPLGCLQVGLLRQHALGISMESGLVSSTDGFTVGAKRVDKPGDVNIS